jgi:hypothetical protein
MLIKMLTQKTKPYCGIKTTAPHGCHLATAQECLDQGQCRRFGLYKIDSRLLNQQKTNQKSVEKQRNKMIMEVVGLKGQILK